MGKSGIFRMPSFGNERRKIALVLSGGAALGLGHIGAIEVIEKHFDIECIIGTSMGSMVGGFYLAGYKPIDMVELVTNLGPIEYFGLFKKGLPGSPILDSKWMHKYLLQKTDCKNIDELNKPYAAVAFDILRRRTVVITKGPLASAMCASSGVPLVFEPFESRGHVLMDGGIEHALPLAFAHIFDKSLDVVAVSALPEIGETPEEIELGNYEKCKGFKQNYLYTSLRTGVYNQSALALQAVLYYKPHLYINVNAEGLRSWEMNKVREFYEVGRLRAEKAIEMKKSNENWMDNLRERFDRIRRIYE